MVKKVKREINKLGEEKPEKESPLQAKILQGENYFEKYVEGVSREIGRKKQKERNSGRSSRSSGRGKRYSVEDCK